MKNPDLPRTLRPISYNGHEIRAIANVDGTFRYSIDGQEFSSAQSSALKARSLACARIDSKGFADEENIEEP
jgi:hypothetical protein